MPQPVATSIASAWTRGGSSSPFDAHTPYAELEREHRSLRDGLASLRSALSGAGRRTPVELGNQVESVREKLSAQFSFEERMGLMHYLLTMRPTVQPQIERLRAEHRDILTTLDRTAATLRGGRAGYDVCATILALLDRFERHELDERQLLRSALR